MLELGRVDLLEFILLEVCLLLIVLGVDLRLFVLIDGREVIGRLDVTLEELLLGITLLGWRTLGVFVGVLRLTELELLELDEA